MLVADSNLNTPGKKKKRDYPITLWSVQRIGMLTMELVEEAPIYISMSTSQACVANL